MSDSSTIVPLARVRAYTPYSASEARTHAGDRGQAKSHKLPVAARIAAIKLRAAYKSLQYQLKTRCYRFHLKRHLRLVAAYEDNENRAAEISGYDDQIRDLGWRHESLAAILEMERGPWAGGCICLEKQPLLSGFATTSGGEKREGNTPEMSCRRCKEQHAWWEELRQVKQKGIWKMGMELKGIEKARAGLSREVKRFRKEFDIKLDKFIERKDDYFGWADEYRLGMWADDYRLYMLDYGVDF